MSGFIVKSTYTSSKISIPIETGGEFLILLWNRYVFDTEWPATYRNYHYLIDFDNTDILDRHIINFISPKQSKNLVMSIISGLLL